MTTLLARLSRTQDRERIDDAALASAVSAVGDEETADWLARHDDGGLPDTVAKPVAAGVDGDAATGLFSMDGPLGAVSKLVALVASLGAVSVVLWLPARLCYRLSRSLLRASG